ncbi:MAG: UDP-glucose 4-epimerase GalE, partial [Bacteroidota bacterium]
GYIGTHIAIELINKNYDVVIVDNLSNSNKESVNRIPKITGKKPKLYIFDVQNARKLDEVFKENKIDSVVHLAGLKAVGESVRKPLEYYENNLYSSINLFKTMLVNGVKKLVFSSSATVYGDPQYLPIDENHPITPTNPYGHTKAKIEQILKDLAISNDGWKITSLRYFNPIGAHKSGLVGENPNGSPNNLVPFVSRVAVGKLEKVMIFGDDYDTKDGTGVRDYIHVVDLARGHVSAIEKPAAENVCNVYNLGTGKGYSVLDAINKFKKASGRDIAYEVTKRRPGDIATCYADPSKANTELAWKANMGLQEACEDEWRWQSNNPNGY